MRAAIYARVSSAGQRDKHTIESQMRVLPEYVARMGWELVATYVDDGRSAKAGELDKRDGLARLMADAAVRRFDVAVVVDVDRLTRSEDIAEMGQVLGAFQRAGVRIANASTGTILDMTSGSSGHLLSLISGWQSAEDNRKRRERVVQGRQTAILRGRKPAGRTPYGWDYEPRTGEWTVNESAARVIREIYDRIIRGESSVAIAEDLSIRTGDRWHHGRVSRIVQLATYRGEWLADQHRKLRVRVPPIVDDLTWERARLVMAGRHRMPKGIRTKHVYLLEGLAVCSLCSTEIGINSESRNGDRVHPSAYVCKHRRRPPAGNERCGLRYWRTAEADDRIWDGLRGLLLRPDLVDEALARIAKQEPGGWEDDLAGYEAQLARLTKAESVILARFRRGLISEQAMDAELEAQSRSRTMLERQLTTARQAAAGAAQRKTAVHDLAQAIRSVQGKLEAVGASERQALVRGLVRPGSVTLGQERIVATVRLSSGYVERSACGTPPVTIAQFQLVA